jgi:vitamin B12 transporter
MTTKTLSLVAASLLLTQSSFAETTLEDITVVSATKTTQNLNAVTSNVEVITAQDIEDRGYTTVTQALNSLPGISFTANGGLGTTTSVYLRGMDSKRTLVLIDGIRYNDVTGTSGAPFAHLMVEDIAQIEVVKGAQSGIWGADAAAGVINIITKKAKNGVHGSAHIETGSFNTKKYGATLSTKTDSYAIHISHNVVDSNSFTAQAPQGQDINNFEDDAYKNQTTSIKLGYNINKMNKIDFAYTLIDAVGDYDTFGNPDGIATAKTKDSFTSLNFNHIDSFNEINLYTKRSKFAREFITTTTSPFDGQVDEYGFNSKIPYGIEDFILVGADYKSFEHKNSINQSYNNKGVFITNNNTFNALMGGITILTESLRYDQYSTFDNAITGKIGIKYLSNTIEGLVVSSNYGTAYTVPTLYQLYAPALVIFGTTYPIGNINLQPEKTKSYDIMLSYKDISITYFNNKIDNLIQYTSGYNNVEGTSNIDGIEITYTKDVLSSLQLSMNYTKLFKAEDTTGNPLIRRAKETFKATVDYYGIEKLHIGSDLEYIGSRTDVDTSIFPSTKVETGKYTVVNFTADYQITKAFQVYGKIENLTNRTYQTVYGYATSPRAFYAGVRAKF